jgi:hypothetical protein
VYYFKQDFLVLNNTISQNFSLYTLFFHLFIFNLNFSLLNIYRDFCFRVCYALLIPAQRVDHGRNTRGPREEYAWTMGGIRVEYAWNTRGPREEYARNTRGPREEYAF